MDYTDFDFGGGEYDPRLDPSAGGEYDPRLDPGYGGGEYDPRLDPGVPGGAYDPRLDTGMPGGGKVPSPGFSLGDIGKGIGLMNKDGSPNWMAILTALGLAGGAAYGINRTNKANDQYQQSIKDANAQITGLLGGSGAAFDPYKQAGLQGLQRLQNAPQSNLAAGFQPLAGRYNPLGTGAAMRGGLSLGNIAKGQ